MSSFQITVTPSRRAAGRFVNRVRRSLQKALAEEQGKRGITQAEVARILGVHRSVINRELRGKKDITLGRVAELAYALGREIVFGLAEPAAAPGSNLPVASKPTVMTANSTSTQTVRRQMMDRRAA